MNVLYVCVRFLSKSHHTKTNDKSVSTIKLQENRSKQGEKYYENVDRYTQRRKTIYIYWLSSFSPFARQKAYVIKKNDDCKDMIIKDYDLNDQ